MSVELALSESQQRLKGIDEFKAVVLTEQVKEYLDAIETTIIDSPGSAEIVKNCVKELKKVGKQIETVRKEITKPYDDQKAAYMEVQKLVQSPILAAIKQAEKKNSEYLDSQAKKAAEQQKALESKQQQKNLFVEQLNFIAKEFFNNLKNAAQTYNNNQEKGDAQRAMQLLNETFSKYISKKAPIGLLWNVAKENDRVPECQTAYDYMFSAGRAVRSYIKGTLDGQSTKAKIDATEKQLNEQLNLSLFDVGEKEQQVIDDINANKNTSEKGVYYNVQFEVENISAVPKEFIVLDINKEKMRQYAKENAKQIHNGDLVVPGIKFTTERRIRG